MGRTFTPMYRLETRLAPAPTGCKTMSNTPIGWSVKEHGKPTTENIEKYVIDYIRSTYLGDINDQISITFGYIPTVVYAQIVCQKGSRSGEVIATWNAPRFMELPKGLPRNFAVEQLCPEGWAVLAKNGEVLRYTERRAKMEVAFSQGKKRIREIADGSYHDTEVHDTLTDLEKVEHRKQKAYNLEKSGKRLRVEPRDPFRSDHPRTREGVIACYTDNLVRLYMRDRGNPSAEYGHFPAGVLEADIRKGTTERCVPKMVESFIKRGQVGDSEAVKTTMRQMGIKTVREFIALITPKAVIA